MVMVTPYGHLEYFNASTALIGSHAKGSSLKTFFCQLLISAGSAVFLSKLGLQIFVINAL
jgi:hypothetical protein